MKTTWKKLISEAMERNGENFSSDVISLTLTPAELKRKLTYSTFMGWILEDGKEPQFRLWTEKNVYFSDSYDDRGFVSCVERHPPSKA
jgi:hypothetical protein